MIVRGTAGWHSKRLVFLAAAANLWSVAACAEEPPTKRMSREDALKEMIVSAPSRAEAVAKNRAAKTYLQARPAFDARLPNPSQTIVWADKLGLLPEQRKKMGTIVEQLDSKSAVLEAEILRVELSLKQALLSQRPTLSSLEPLLVATEKSRTALRAAHFAAILETHEVLSPTQLQAYRALLDGSTRTGSSAPPSKSSSP